MDAALVLAERMLKEGATILDVGGMSSRPGAKTVAAEEELRRVVPVIDAVHRRFPEALISIDTWRAGVAEEAVEAGASLVQVYTGFIYEGPAIVRSILKDLSRG